MSAQSCDFPVIQHQDLVRVKNGAYTLGDDDDSRIFVASFKAWRRAASVFASSGKTVVKDINSGFLPVPWRWKGAASVRLKIRAPLSCMGSQAIRQVIYKARLSCIQSCPQLRLRGVGISIPQVFFNGAGKEPGFLGYIKILRHEAFSGEVPDIGSIQTNPSGVTS